MAVRGGGFRMDRTVGELRGYEATLKVFERAQNVTSSGVLLRMLRTQAEYVLKQSQYYCPVETGALKESGRVVVAANDRGRPEVSVVYGLAGGGNSDLYYAVFVHEIPATHAWPTQWKYLEQAVKDVWGTLTGIAADALDLGRSFFVEYGSV